MPRVAIVGQYLDTGMAVGHDALEMKRLLAEQGHEVALFSSHWIRKTDLTRDTAELADFLADDPQAILIYHHAIGWAPGVDLCSRLRCRRVVRYHNVTPAHFFAGYPGEERRACEEGRDQLRALVAADCDLYLSASLYSQQELLQLGASSRRCLVVPPFHPMDRLETAAADPCLREHLRDGTTNLLFVGRCAPNKGHRYLIDAFACYHEHYNPRSRLVLVGGANASLMAYGNQLRAQAECHGLLDRVVFLARASESELKACYESAHVFLLASEHEGFCVPVVEAMAMKVPIIAYGTTAVPETLADAGLSWEEPSPFLLAESIARVLQDRTLHDHLVARGWQRYQSHFRTEVVAGQFRSAMTSLLPAA